MLMKTRLFRDSFNPLNKIFVSVSHRNRFPSQKFIFNHCLTKTKFLEGEKFEKHWINSMREKTFSLRLFLWNFLRNFRFTDNWSDSIEFVTSGASHVCSTNMRRDRKPPQYLGLFKSSRSYPRAATVLRSKKIRTASGHRRFEQGENDYWFDLCNNPSMHYTRAKNWFTWRSVHVRLENENTNEYGNCSITQLLFGFSQWLNVHTK